VPVPQLTAAGSLSQQIRQVKNQAKNGSYPAMQQLLNQYSVPKSSVATLSGNRSVQRQIQRSSESKPSISVPKSLQPAFSSFNIPVEQSKK
ncbi:CD3337/EF1877 family mobilome membrane protein, partial [Enterococcus faecalis]